MLIYFQQVELKLCNMHLSLATIQEKSFLDWKH